MPLETIPISSVSRLRVSQLFPEDEQGSLLGDMQAMEQNVAAEQHADSPLPDQLQPGRHFTRFHSQEHLPGDSPVAAVPPAETRIDDFKPTKYSRKSEPKMLRSDKMMNEKTLDARMNAKVMRSSSVPMRGHTMEADIIDPLKSQRDELVMDTNKSSIVSKRSVEKLYYAGEPEYFRHFVSKFKRRSPLINRGYWLRMKSIEHTVTRFLSERTAKSKVVINLGCG